ncbi:PPE domain-containing protein [Saccharothrix obliqua]|uniref:PPE domain-containing protein n=1 Tax=Saccharothrix obliqua TaxID=2861747 RepID=UPI001C5E45F5|nr:PPE domain-containing protein [Saccharothrix obliqua]MBW4716176.1 PPE family protein [Saccharothrix obliqua]
MPDGHRWNGYSHQELYEKIHAGPGPQASHASVERWAGVSAALSEINAELLTGVLKSGASWEGAAADQARQGINPLAAWADDARGGAEVMRLSAELQADYIAKARADMPPPVKVTAEDPGLLLTGLTHLVGGQTDYEKQERAQNAAEQRAREVMTTYASSTTSNVSTLGQFHQPPQLLISAPDLVRNGDVGVGGHHGYLGGRGGHGWNRGGWQRGGGRGERGRYPGQSRPVAQPGGTTGTSGTSGSTAGTTPGSTPGATTRTANGGPATSSAHPVLGVGGVLGGAAHGRDDRRKSSSDTTTEQHQLANPADQPLGRPSGTTAASSADFGAIAAANAQHAAAGSSAAPGSVLGAGQQNSGDTVHKRTVGVPAAPQQQAFDPFGGLGRGRADEEEDGTHNGADYLRETDDIYGVGGIISPPVIGESTTS